MLGENLHQQPRENTSMAQVEPDYALSTAHTFLPSEREPSPFIIRHSSFVLFLIIAIGLALRLYRYDALSLWLDEGITVQVSRLPWWDVLGFNGAYETHPPLYFVLVKLAALGLPDTEAGRFVSVLAGALTLPVMYLLAQRLVGKGAALFATALLALSPLHVWYSQEARMYTLTMLFLALSYLALVAWVQSESGQRGWATLYGVSIALALYADYSAMYALAPQLFLLLYLTRLRGSRVLPLWVAGVVGCLLFLPWVSQLLGTMQTWGTQRASYLGVTPEKVWTTLVAMCGFVENGTYFWVPDQTPWQTWPFLHYALFLGSMPILFMGVVALWRRGPLAFLVALLSFVGTIAVTGFASLLSPGFVERTVLFALVGWALLVGAALPLLTGQRQGWFRVAALASLACVLAVSLISLFTIYRYGDKQHWRELAADTSRIISLGKPVLTYPTITGPILEIYEPDALAGQYISIGDLRGLPALPSTDALWLVSTRTDGLERLGEELEAQGYRRILHKTYWVRLYLDLYARQGVQLGAAVPLNGDFRGEGAGAVGWQLPTDGSSLVAGELTLTNTGGAERIAATSVEGEGDALYTLELEVRSLLTAGGVRSFLICNSPQAALLIAPDGLGASVPNDGAWHTVSIAALCPAGAQSVAVDLRNAGVGEVSFRDVKLFMAPLR